jgi:hypothetical protein
MADLELLAEQPLQIADIGARIIKETVYQR